MQSSVVRRLIFLCALLALPGLALAQEATLTGTITDSTGGVLPGVTVVAVNEASGNQFESVSRFLYSWMKRSSLQTAAPLL